jgi:hypothetical protein
MRGKHDEHLTFLMTVSENIGITKLSKKEKTSTIQKAGENLTTEDERFFYGREKISGNGGGSVAENGGGWSFRKPNQVVPANRVWRIPATFPQHRAKQLFI